MYTFLAGKVAEDFNPACLFRKQTKLQGANYCGNIADVISCRLCPPGATFILTGF